jgi:hypothetical protein
MPLSSIPAEQIYDGREVPCSLKHNQIFERAFDLTSGDYFTITIPCRSATNFS